MLYKKGNLEYNSETGQLFRCWKQKKKEIRTSGGVGYFVVKVNGKQTYPVHRVIWELVYGECPEDKVIDHIDQNKQNNKLDNLRLVSKSENAINSKLFSTNTTGHRGISYSTRDKTFSAEVRKENSRIRKSGFKTIEEAIHWRTKIFQSIWGYLFSEELA